MPSDVKYLVFEGGGGKGFAYLGALRALQALKVLNYVKPDPKQPATADGKRFKASLFRRDPGGPKGVADTQQLTLYISNQGDGRVSTPEEQGQGLMALAGALTVREAAGAKPPPLSTMKEHRASFPIRDAHGPRGPTDRPRDAGAADGPADR